MISLCIGTIKVFSGGTASSDYQFAVFHIVDDELVNMGYIVTIFGEKGSIQMNISDKAYVIETR